MKAPAEFSATSDSAAKECWTAEAVGREDWGGEEGGGGGKEVKVMMGVSSRQVFQVTAVFSSHQETRQTHCVHQETNKLEAVDE